MDICYPLSNKSLWHDNELRYSLRGIEKFIPHDRVFVIGHRPSWLVNVIHIPFLDSYVSIKDANIISKLLRVCSTDISDEFAFWSDDQYAVSQKANEFLPKAKYSGELTGGSGQYRKMCFTTKETLKSRGLPTRNFDCHLPQVINKYDYINVMLQTPFGQGHGILTNSFYFNSTSQVIIEKMNVEGFINHGDIADEPTRQKLIELFPDKSKYEV